MIQKFQTGLLICFIAMQTESFSEEGRFDTRMPRARQLFYQSVESADSIEIALSLFEEIGETEIMKGVALTYQGALTALKGKYARMPVSKYRRVIEGLEMMDQGVQRSAGNIEARFIRGMTCYYLPLFFNRKKTAHEDFRIIVGLLGRYYHDYPGDLLLNVTEFLLAHAELTEDETRLIERVRYDLENDDE